jgi:hypothetical protein
MAHIYGFERDQILLLPEAVDDYAAPTIPSALLTPLCKTSISSRRVSRG